MNVLAQAAASLDTDGAVWVQTIAQLATAGGFGGMVWYFITRYIPSIEDRHRADRVEWEQRHRAEREQLWKDHSDRTAERDALMRAMVESHIVQFRTMAEGIKTELSRIGERT